MGARATRAPRASPPRPKCFPPKRTRTAFAWKVACAIITQQTNKQRPSESRATTSA